MVEIYSIKELCLMWQSFPFLRVLSTVMTLGYDVSSIQQNGRDDHIIDLFVTLLTNCKTK
jgi:hypothetical protein